MREAKKCVIGMKIFGEGKFKTPEEREASMRFVLQQRCVDAMIIGMESKEQIADTLQQLQGVMKSLAPSNA